MSQRTGVSPADLAANYQMQGRNKFTAGFGSGGDEHMAQAMAAADHLEENAGRYLARISHQEPADLAGPRAIASLEAQGLARPGENLPQALRELGREEFIRAHGGGPEAEAAAGYLEALARQREMVTQGKVAKELRDTVVPTPEWVFNQAGAKPAKVYADYTSLQRKHPDQFATAEEARAHVEHVMAWPEYLLPATKPEYTLLVRRNGADKAAVVEFQMRGGKYRVRSAYRLSAGQLERKLAKAADQGGSSGPPSPARNPQAGGISSGSPTAPSNAVRLDPSDSMVSSAGGEVKAGPGRRAMDQAAGQAKDLGNAIEAEPSPPRLAAQVGRAAGDSSKAFFQACIWLG
ncbi:MAG: hypothetical protein ACOZHQ_01895 [Thermodesulfobacteriota bacterium]